MGDTSSGLLRIVEGMPWLETSPVKERKQFIAAVLAGEHSFAEVCRRFGISRKNGYKWVHRFREEGGAEGLDPSLEDRSRRPHHSPSAISEELESAIVATRKRHPTWGPKKLRVRFMKYFPQLEPPSESTFATVIKRNGLVKPRRRRNRTAPYRSPLAHATRPNAVWCIDYKGDFPIGRTRCYPLTITDAYSRYVIACVALTSTETTATRRALERIFDEYGVPDAIRSDNGSPFAARGLAGLSRLSAWWHKLGIRHERIEPAHPEQNGQHERMHFDLERVLELEQPRTLAAAQQVFDKFRQEFNFERPHEALGMRTPSDFYEVSKRCLPEPKWGRDFEYRPNVEVVQVSKLGYARCHRGTFYASNALTHERLGIDWRGDQTASVYFGRLLLGTLKVKRGHRGVVLVPVEKVSPVSSNNLSPMSSNSAPA
jgi:putative transposase